MFPDYNFIKVPGHHLIFKVFHIVVLIFLSKVIASTFSLGKSGSSNKRCSLYVFWIPAFMVLVSLLLFINYV